jgi:hypothetical protein
LMEIYHSFKLIYYWIETNVYLDRESILVHVPRPNKARDQGRKAKLESRKVEWKD